MGFNIGPTPHVFGRCLATEAESDTYKKSLSKFPVPYRALPSFMLARNICAVGAIVSRKDAPISSDGIDFKRRPSFLASSGSWETHLMLPRGVRAVLTTIPGPCAKAFVPYISRFRQGYTIMSPFTKNQREVRMKPELDGTCSRKTRVKLSQVL
jgi:hypothetical protein